ncbi:MAG: DNA-processing protein DprA [Deltaproteobacteria bacterium]|nr:DNA-processing protein DprA [Deltaproteobacteria bacterium]
MNEEALKYWIALRSVEEVGCVGFRNLLAAFSSPQKVFAAPVASLQAIPGIGPKTADRIHFFSDWKAAEGEVVRAQTFGVSIVTCQDPLYPRHLLNIYDYPPYLYVKGSLDPEETAVAVVGSRLASVYGRFVTEKLSRELALRGLTVVSGLARGIDAAAHRGALAGKGRTIAVLGCGLDVIYPPENKDLAADCAVRGAVVTEFPFGTPPNAPHFPARNRIISGISLGVVVVEAGEKSGSLITARIAAEQGRSVFAVPGAIESAGSRGTHRLIKQGAKLVETVEDILEEIIPQTEVALRNTQSPPKAPTTESIPFPKRVSADFSSAAAEGLADTEKMLLSLISPIPIDIDTLITASGLAPRDVQSGLLVLELAGHIRQLPGKLFLLKES